MTSTPTPKTIFAKTADGIRYAQEATIELPSGPVTVIATAYAKVDGKPTATYTVKAADGIYAPEAIEWVKGSFRVAGKRQKSYRAAVEAAMASHATTVPETGGDADMGPSEDGVDRLVEVATAAEAEIAAWSEVTAAEAHTPVRKPRARKTAAEKAETATARQVRAAQRKHELREAAIAEAQANAHAAQADS